MRIDLGEERREVGEERYELGEDGFDMDGVREGVRECVGERVGTSLLRLQGEMYTSLKLLGYDRVTSHGKAVGRTAAVTWTLVPFRYWTLSALLLASFDLFSSGAKLEAE